MCKDFCACYTGHSLTCQFGYPWESWTHLPWAQKDHYIILFGQVAKTGTFSPSRATEALPLGLQWKLAVKGRGFCSLGEVDQRGTGELQTSLEL